MLPDRVSNPGPLTYESGVLPIALRGPALENWVLLFKALLISLTKLSVKDFLGLLVLIKLSVLIFF